MKNERKEALAVLSDEIYSMLRDARLAKFSIGELLEGYFDDDDLDGSRQCAERLMANYFRAQSQVSILLDYICRLTQTLQALDSAARGK